MSDPRAESGEPSGEPSHDPSGPRNAPAFDEAVASRGTAHETPELHRLLVETVRDYAIFALDPTGHVLTWNAGAERFKGWRAEEIIGRHFSAFYPPEDITAGRPEWALRQALEHGSVETEGWRVRKDGSRFWADVVITALRDHDGQLIGFAKVTRDLSERRRAQEKLRQSEERFRLIVQSVRDYAIFMLDPRGCIATWNEGAQRIKGYTAEQIIGRHFSVFYPQEAVASGFPQHELDVAGATGRFEDEGWRIKRDGSRFWANVVITALRNEHGELVGFAKVTRDLTERRQSEERAIADARRIAEVEAANRTKSEFLATLSHELRTPLNAIGGYAELLDLEVAGGVTADQRLYLQRIGNAQRHMLALVNDLLQLSRLETGHLEYDAAPIPLRSMLQEVQALLLPQAQSRQLTLEVDVRAPEPIAFADAARTHQILLNLVSNAVKFTPEGGRVELACARSGDNVEITVSDTGPGIPPDKLDSIFEPFVQVGRTYASPREGIGLGLAISRDLARAMNGDLTARSTVGEGSVFTLTLPRAQRGRKQR